MAENNIGEIMEFFKSKLSDNGLTVEKLVLFGSNAAGAAGSGSDLDIAVVSDDFQGRDIFERVGMLKDSRAAVVIKYKVPLDVILMTVDEFENEKSPVADECRTGLVVFAA